MHVKPSRFPRNTNRKKKFGQYYTPKPDSPWYKYVEYALTHPSMLVQAEPSSSTTETVEVPNASQLLLEEELKKSQEDAELRAKSETRKKRKEERTQRKQHKKE